MTQPTILTSTSIQQNQEEKRKRQILFTIFFLGAIGFLVILLNRPTL